MNTLYKFSDLRNSLILGVLIAFFTLFVINNLEDEITIPDFLSYSKWIVFFIIPVLLTLWTYLTFNVGTRWPFFFQFGKFVIIGASNTALDFGILNLLMFITGIESGLLFSIFKAVSFVIALINSFLWNKYWTFQDLQNKELGKQFIRFVSISVVAFFINVSIASYIVNVLGPTVDISPRLWANIGAFASLIITIVWNFFGYKFIVFR